MSNETIKKFDLTVKLRGDNVYDLYLDGEWLASRGSTYGIAEEVKKAMMERLY